MQYQGFLEAWLFVVVLNFSVWCFSCSKEFQAIVNHSFISFVSSSAVTSLVISRCMQYWFFKIFVWAYLFGHITLKQRRWREASLLDKFYWFIAFACNAKSFTIASVFIFFSSFSLQRFWTDWQKFF